MLLLLLLPPHAFAVCVHFLMTGHLPACPPSVPAVCATPPAAVSYLLILDLFFNFFRYFVSKSWHEQCLWGGAAQVRVGQDDKQSMWRACWLLLASADDEPAVPRRCCIALQLCSSCARAWRGASHRQCTASLCWSGRQLLHNVCAGTGLCALLPLRPAPHKLCAFACCGCAPTQMKHFLTSLNAQVLHLAAAHDRYLSAVDPFVTLKVGCVCVQQLRLGGWVGAAVVVVVVVGPRSAETASQSGTKFAR